MAFKPGRGRTDGNEAAQAEDAIAKLRQVDVLVSQGQSVAETIRSIGVTEVTRPAYARRIAARSAMLTGVPA